MEKSKKTLHMTSILIIGKDDALAKKTAETLSGQGYHVLDIIADQAFDPAPPYGNNPEFGLRTVQILPEELPPTASGIRKDHFFIKDNHRFEKVKHHDILWFKAENSYVEIKTISKRYLLTSDTLGSMLKKTPEAGLLRIHRSYAINLDKVDAIEGNRVIINQQYLPIGKNYQIDVKRHFTFI